MTWTEAKETAASMANEWGEPAGIWIKLPRPDRYEVGLIRSNLDQPLPIWTAFPE